MTVDEILWLTGASRSTFYRWRTLHAFPAPTCVGFFDAVEVKAWLTANAEIVAQRFQPLRLTGPVSLNLVGDNQERIADASEVSA